MSGISFFSEDKYLYIPSRKRPKVILAVGNATIAKNAHKLYNPFSFKGKLLKSLSQFLLVNFNGLMIHLIKSREHKKSDFVSHLEKTLNAKFNVSIYNATLKDKVVLQLQSEDKIYGYLKFPLCPVSARNIEIEKRAIKLLSKKRIIQPSILEATYNGVPYFILPELKGTIGNLKDDAVKSLISKFKKKERYKLANHPRVKHLYKDIKLLKLDSYKFKLDSILERSTVYYYAAFEHGDFTPWNIVITDNGLVPFDFEFFVEDGLEYFDLIKYHFQIGRLLKGKKANELCNYLYSKIPIPEIKCLISLFLIKEIIMLKKINQSYTFHDNMLTNTIE